MAITNYTIYKLIMSCMHKIKFKDYGVNSTEENLPIKLSNAH